MTERRAGRRRRPARRSNERSPVTTLGSRAGEARLKRTVEAFPASDGNIYILRGTETAEFVVPDASPWDRALLEALGSRPATEPLQATLDRLGLEVEADELERSLSTLAELGLLEEPPPAGGAVIPREAAERSQGQLLYFADMAPPGTHSQECQRRLSEARVVVLGCGGLGSWTLWALACAGVGTLVLVDDDTVELGNLNRQLLFRASDLGRLKVEAAAETLSAFDPAIRLEAIPHRVRGPEDVASVAAGADLVIGTADWPIYEIGRWVNEACFGAGIPHTSAAQFPPFVRVGPLYEPGRTGCVECLEVAGRREYPLYDELAAFRRARGVTAATIGAASGLIGSLLAMDAIHQITGIVEPATLGSAAVVDLRTLEVTRDGVTRERGCPVCSALPAGR